MIPLSTVNRVYPLLIQEEDQKGVNTKNLDDTPTALLAHHHVYKPPRPMEPRERHQTGTHYINIYEITSTLS